MAKGKTAPQGAGRNILAAAAIVAAAALGLAGCLERPAYAPPAPAREELIFLDIEEAEQLALYLDEEVRFDRSLMKRVFFDLSLIRGAFGGSIAAVNRIAFRPPCAGDGIAIRFDAETFELIAAGRYEAWRELNERYGAVSLEMQRNLRAAIILFEGLLDYRALAAAYAALPGALEAACLPLIGDGPNIYPRRTDTGIAYLFRDAWGDCADVCERNEFFYFVCENDDAVFVGHWNPLQADGPPAWWDEARGNLPSELAHTFR